jgi:hypothetical protein
LFETEMTQFADVTFVVYTAKISGDNYSLLRNKLGERSSTRFHFRFKNEKLNHNEKLEEFSWIDCPLGAVARSFVSTKPLPLQPISYFEIELGKGCNHRGIFIGVRNAAFQTLRDYSCVMNYSFEGDAEYANVKYKKVYGPGNGGVFGIVVDRREDIVRFYLNGERIGESMVHPSEFGDMYAYVSLSYGDQSFRQCDWYRYEDLKNYTSVKRQSKGYLCNIL